MSPGEDEQSAGSRFLPGGGLLPGGVDAAVWAYVDHATRRAAAETLATLDTRATVQRLAERYVNHGNPQRAGHLFEVMHALAFNRNAIRAGASVRAQVTEWAAGGSQTAPADIHLHDGGRLVAEAQAKLVNRTAALAHDLARPRYAGMQRLVATDKRAAVDNLLDRRLRMPPEGVRFDDYRDTRAHLTDELHHGSVRSRGISRREADRAAQHPGRWANTQVVGAAGREVVTAGLAGAAGGALIGTVVGAATVAARARAGETAAGAAAVTVAGSAARNAARSGAMAGLGQTVRVAARAGLLPEVFGGGTLPMAMAGAACGVADAGFDFARGRIDAGEFAARSATVTTAAGLAWACGAVGQTVIPIPVVGALVGGLVGQAVGTLVVQGLQVAIVAARADGVDEPRLQLLEHELMTAVATTAALGDAAEALGRERNAYVAEIVLPRLARVQATLATADPAQALVELAEVTRAFGGQPIFTTMDEFDRWMADRDAVLSLDPNW
ncbi:hypothetical protein [Frankia sp. CiP3]|uniref:hypothetical protein n=1 Tax=Frankia sp. CiP3 TaxID=2880971 RepID=UPI001EF712B3|nr:hypothetical protein [Frankia sp. CiP3]